MAAVGVLAVTAGSLAIAAQALRRRLAPSWSGPPALLSELILALALLVAIGEIAGVAGLLEAPAIVIGAMLAAGCALAVGGGSSRLGTTVGWWRFGRGVTAWPVSWRGLAGALVALAVACLGVQWLALTLAGLDRGMLNQDTLWYHLPIAAQFVQDGSITREFFASTDPLSTVPRDTTGLPTPSAGPTFYPASSSLLHAIGILLVGRDTLSTLMNFGWLGLALLASWCVGRPAGVAPATLAAGALALSVPALAATQPGDAVNDVSGVALLLAAAALVIHARARSGAVLLPALAVGLAVGMKLTFVAPALALAAGAVWLSGRGSRLRSAMFWLAGMVGLGGVWYVRNLVHTGSPLPLVKLGIGDLAFPTVDLPGLDRFRQSVADYATDFEVWRTAFLPSLPEGFGEAWPLVLGLTAGGIALGVAMPRLPAARMLALVASASALAYLVTPQSAGGAEAHNPGLFLFNMRFLTPAIALGLVVLPLSRPFKSHRQSALLAAGLALTALATLALSHAWPDNERYTIAAAAVLIALGAAAVAILRLRGARPGLAAAAAAGLFVAAVVGGWPVQDNYLDQRYRGADLERRATYRWAAGVSGARIAIVGLVALGQYPLNGSDISNVVGYPGREEERGALRPLGSCRAWRRALADGGYDYAVISPFDPTREPIERQWTRPGSKEILRDGEVSIFELRARPSPADCR